MEGLLDILIPLIAAAIWVLANWFNRNGETDERGRRRGAGDGDATARQREIQEEIRRKIQERRRAAAGETARPRVEAAAPREAPARSLRERQKTTREPAHSREAPAWAEPASTEPATFSWDSADNPYERGIEDRLKQIEATRREAAALSRKAGEVGSGQIGTEQIGTEEIGSRSRRRGRRRGASPAGPVRRALRDPAAARTAFVYREVMGPPIALRRRQSDLPGLS